MNLTAYNRACSIIANPDPHWDKAENDVEGSLDLEGVVVITLMDHGIELNDAVEAYLLASAKGGTA